LPSISYEMIDMSIELQHWSGAGNRFVVIDNRKKSIQHLSTKLVKRLCQRSLLPNAEGLLVLLDIDQAHSSCTYDFYNPDGSTGVMCGNGARCAVRHAISIEHWQTKNIQLFFNGCSYNAHVNDGDRIALCLPLYKELRLNKCWTYVNVGSDHVILDARQLVSSIDEFHRFDLIRYADEHLNTYRNQIGVRSLNLNLAYVTSDTLSIHLRTYENGVFDETQACGTGAVSTAIAFWTRKLVRQVDIHCIPKSERVLIVHLDVDEQNQSIVGMILEGDARQDACATQFDTMSTEAVD
jgi:diaminopimelate epimerase